VTGNGPFALGLSLPRLTAWEVTGNCPFALGLSLPRLTAWEVTGNCPFALGLSLPRLTTLRLANRTIADGNGGKRSFVQRNLMSDRGLAKHFADIRNS
jgi:hypothetical protein